MRPHGHAVVPSIIERQRRSSIGESGQVFAARDPAAFLKMLNDVAMVAAGTPSFFRHRASLLGPVLVVEQMDFFSHGAGAMALVTSGFVIGLGFAVAVGLLGGGGLLRFCFGHLL